MVSVSRFLFQCLSHPWLRATDSLEENVIKTENLRRYLVRRKWLRYGQVIKAANRLSGLEFEFSEGCEVDVVQE